MYYSRDLFSSAQHYNYEIHADKNRCFIYFKAV